MSDLVRPDTLLYMPLPPNPEHVCKRCAQSHVVALNMYLNIELDLYICVSLTGNAHA